MLLLGCLAAGCYLSDGPSFRMDGDTSTDPRPDEVGGEAVCGNGAREAGEECDDGNTVPGDGCDEDCRIETCVPGEEVCNGEDDDCDGLVDEDDACTCNDPNELEVLSRITVPGPGDAADPSIVWSGSEYGIVWTNGFARVDRGGRLIESSASHSLMGSSPADIFWSRAMGLYVYCWSSGADVLCGTHDPDSDEQQRLAVVDREHEGISYGNPRTAWNEDQWEFAVVYPTGMYAAQIFTMERIGTDFEAVADPEQINERHGTTIYDTALTWTGDLYAFIHTSEGGDIYLSTLDDEGRVISSDLHVTSVDELEYISNNLLWDGSLFRLGVSNFHDLFMLTFDRSGLLLYTNQVTDYEGSALVYSPVLAKGPWVGMVWNDASGECDGVWFNVLEPDGEPLREPILLSETGLYPWVATDGETFLVAWREGEDIWNPDIAIARIGCP